MTKQLLTITFLAIGLMAILLLSCRKEGDVLLEITAESFGGDAKLQLDGKYATWESGDLIRINGTTVEVTRNANGHAYIPATAASDVNMALFPSTLCDAISGEVVTVTLPSEYTYRTAGGQQVLALPMAAVSAAGSPLHFRHLTGALMLTVEGAMTLESITVVSDKYQLSGSRTLRFDNIGGQEPVVTSDASQRRVTMLFDAVEVSSSLDVILPIAAVGSDNHFTIEIEARREGTRYHFRRTQQSGGALAQNVMAYTATTVIGNASTTTGPLFSGSGFDEGDPFRIATPNDFRAMVDAINNDWTLPGSGNRYRQYFYKLTDSLDLQGVTISPIDSLSIGRTFNGGGFAIKNLTITSVTGSSEARCGLFSYLYSGCAMTNLIMRNITLKHVGVSSIPLYISPLCADARNCSISNCTVDGVTLDLSGTISEIQYGAMVGHISGNTITISNCTVKGSVAIPTLSNTLYFGGLIGRIENSGAANISQCRVDNQTVSVVSSSQVNIGGIIGNMPAGTTATVSNITWNGNMSVRNTSNSASSHIGGVIGRFVNNNNNGQLTISDCSLSGTISVESNYSIYLGAYIGRVANPNGSNLTLPATFPASLVLTLNGSSCDNLIGSNQ